MAGVRAHQRKSKKSRIDKIKRQLCIMKNSGVIDFRTSFDDYINARSEFRHAKLGDKRRTMRLILLYLGLLRRPGSAISLCCGAPSAQLISRFFARKEVTLGSILNSHVTETVGRIKEAVSDGAKHVFVSQDTTNLNYQNRKKLKGLGYTDGGRKCLGIMMHSALAMTIEGLPLGFLDINTWTRDFEKDSSEDRQPDEKESFKWIKALRNAQKKSGSSELPIVMLCDREADFFGLFAEPRPENWEIIVRAAQNRCIEDPEHKKMNDAMKNAQERFRYELLIPRKSNQKERKAEIGVKYENLSIKPPESEKKRYGKDAINLNYIVAEELSPPDGIEPVKWRLLTTLPVESDDDAIYALKAYSRRWLIEEFHLVLKDQVDVESLQLETIKRMYSAICLMSIVSWRLLYMVKQYSRIYPEAAARVLGNADEIETLQIWLKQNGRRKSEIVTTEDFVRAVAMLGGFMGRKCDGKAGVRAVCEGLDQLDGMVCIYQALKQ